MSVCHKHQISVVDIGHLAIDLKLLRELWVSEPGVDVDHTIGTFVLKGDLEASMAHPNDFSVCYLICFCHLSVYLCI